MILPLLGCLVLLFGGAAGAWWWGHHPPIGWHWRGPLGLHADFDLPDSLQTTNERLAAQLATEHALAQASAPKRQAITQASDQHARAADATIEVRYRTLVQKVRENVPPDDDPVVPDGLVGLLDAAAAGGDDAVSVTAGLSHERSAPAHLSTLGAVVIENYGLSNRNAAQLSALQDWIRQQQAVH